MKTKECELDVLLGLSTDELKCIDFDGIREDKLGPIAEKHFKAKGKSLAWTHPPDLFRSSYDSLRKWGRMSGAMRKHALDSAARSFGKMRQRQLRESIW